MLKKLEKLMFFDFVSDLSVWGAGRAFQSPSCPLSRREGCPEGRLGRKEGRVLDGLCAHYVQRYVRTLSLAWAGGCHSRSEPYPGLPAANTLASLGDLKNSTGSPGARDSLWTALLPPQTASGRPSFRPRRPSGQPSRRPGLTNLKKI